MMKSFYLLLCFSQLFAQNAKLNDLILNREVGSFTNPQSISGNSFGEIFILADEKIFKLNSEGETIDSIGGIGWSELNFNGSNDICATFPLYIFVTEKNNRRIQKIDKNFYSSFIIDATGLNIETESDFEPIATAISAQQEIFMLEKNIPSLVKLNSNLEFVKEIAGKNNYSQLLQNPKDIVSFGENLIAVLDLNFCFVFDWAGNLISKFKTPSNSQTISSFGKNILITTKNEILALATNGELIFKTEKIIGVKEKINFKDVYFNGECFFILTETKLLVAEVVRFEK